MKGLTPNTTEVLEKISSLDMLREFMLIGGSALALQIQHRLSEDLDFCKWKSPGDDNPTINWKDIEHNFSMLEIKNINVLDFNLVDFFVANKIKISFYADQLYHSPIKEKMHIAGNIFVPDIQALGAMKLELMLRRSNFRDYYDIYSILKAGISLKEMVYAAGKYSNHRLKSKNIISFISNGENYKKERAFDKLEPKYIVTEKEIEQYIKQCILAEFKV